MMPAARPRRPLVYTVDPIALARLRSGIAQRRRERAFGLFMLGLYATSPAVALAIVLFVKGC